MAQNASVNIVPDEDLALLADFDNRYRCEGVKRASLQELPIIDLTPFTGDGDDAARTEVAAQLRSACVDLGFFYMKGHGFSDSDLSLLLDWGHRFFALPRESKIKFPFRVGEGFVDAGVVNSAGAQAPLGTIDVKERLLFPRQAAMNEAERATYPENPYAWPDDSVFPGFRAFIEAFNYRAVAVAQKIGWALSRSLGMDENGIERALGRHSAAIVYNYYPPMDPSSIDKTQWSFSPHADFGSFNMLLQDESVTALEVRNAAGEWIDVPPIPGALVVNIGNLLARATNDLYPSALHRVANVSGSERLSVSMFTGPPFTSELKCLETCHAPDNPPKYPPVLIGDYVQALLKHANYNGRVAVDADNNRFR